MDELTQERIVNNTAAAQGAPANPTDQNVQQPAPVQAETMPQEVRDFLAHRNELEAQISLWYKFTHDASDVTGLYRMYNDMLDSAASPQAQGFLQQLGWIYELIQSFFDSEPELQNNDAVQRQKALAAEKLKQFPEIRRQIAETEKYMKGSDFDGLRLNHADVPKTERLFTDEQIAKYDKLFKEYAGSSSQEYKDMEALYHMAAEFNPELDQVIPGLGDRVRHALYKAAAAYYNAKLPQDHNATRRNRMNLARDLFRDTAPDVARGEPAAEKQNVQPEYHPLTAAEAAAQPMGNGPMSEEDRNKALGAMVDELHKKTDTLYQIRRANGDADLYTVGAEMGLLRTPLDNAKTELAKGPNISYEGLRVYLTEAADRANRILNFGNKTKEEEALAKTLTGLKARENTNEEQNARENMSKELDAYVERNNRRTAVESYRDMLLGLQRRIQNTDSRFFNRDSEEYKAMAGEVGNMLGFLNGTMLGPQAGDGVIDLNSPAFNFRLDKLKDAALDYFNAKILQDKNANRQTRFDVAGELMNLPTLSAYRQNLAAGRYEPDENATFSYAMIRELEAADLRNEAGVNAFLTNDSVHKNVFDFYSGKNVKFSDQLSNASAMQGARMVYDLLKKEQEGRAILNDVNPRNPADLALARRDVLLGAGLREYLAENWKDPSDNYEKNLALLDAQKIEKLKNSLLQGKSMAAMEKKLQAEGVDFHASARELVPLPPPPPLPIIPQPEEQQQPEEQPAEEQPLPVKKPDQEEHITITGTPRELYAAFYKAAQTALKSETREAMPKPEDYTKDLSNKNLSFWLEKMSEKTTFDLTEMDSEKVGVSAMMERFGIKSDVFVNATEADAFDLRVDFYEEVNALRKQDKPIEPQPVQQQQPVEESDREEHITITDTRGKLYAAFYKAAQTALKNEQSKNMLTPQEYWQYIWQTDSDLAYKLNENITIDLTQMASDNITVRQMMEIFGIKNADLSADLLNATEADAFNLRTDFYTEVTFGKDRYMESEVEEKPVVEEEPEIEEPVVEEKPIELSELKEQLAAIGVAPENEAAFKDFKERLKPLFGDEKNRAFLTDAVSILKNGSSDEQKLLCSMSDNTVKYYGGSTTETLKRDFQKLRENSSDFAEINKVTDKLAQVNTSSKFNDSAMFVMLYGSEGQQKLLGGMTADSLHELAAYYDRHPTMKFDSDMNSLSNSLHGREERQKSCIGAINKCADRLKLMNKSDNTRIADEFTDVLMTGTQEMRDRLANMSSELEVQLSIRARSEDFGFLKKLMAATAVDKTEKTDGAFKLNDPKPEVKKTSKTVQQDAKKTDKPAQTKNSKKMDDYDFEYDDFDDEPAPRRSGIF